MKYFTNWNGMATEMPLRSPYYVPSKDGEDRLMLQHCFRATAIVLEQKTYFPQDIIPTAGACFPHGIKGRKGLHSLLAYGPIHWKSLKFTVLTIDVGELNGQVSASKKCLEKACQRSTPVRKYEKAILQSADRIRDWDASIAKLPTSSDL